MQYQIPLFARFGGGPNGPNIARQVLIIFSAWVAAKLFIGKPRGGDAATAYKYAKPKILQ